ncbi:MAG: Do family serine endopeptidase [Hyphomicrobiales bacterium]|nr:Do family serine endopeptidase [Hyphomicrobiales bacterium]
MARFPARLAATLAFAALATLPTAYAVAETSVPETKGEIALSFAPVVRRVAPAVVNVYATRKVAQPVNPLFADPFFRQFFGGGEAAPSARIQASLGSGTIVDPSGVIVTNVHVIRDATDVKVALADKREYEADILLKDERTDVAVIKIRQKGVYPSVEIGDSENLQVGDLVLAAGNPFGVGQTVTQGIVSGLARTQVGNGDYRYFIQTDAAINPGNSGGALVDLAGRLVGVPSQIYSQSGGSVGIGFAIPSTIVKFVLEQAKTGSVVHRPWLGATLQNVTADVAEGLGVDRPIGALVTGLVKGGPAAEAGLEIGDLLIAVDGREVDDPDAFGFRFGTRPLGGSVPVELIRKGRRQNIAIASRAAPETPPREAKTIDVESPFAGATVMNLSPAVAEELRLPFDLDGVVVASVAGGSPAARIGLQKGDVVREINGAAVDRTATLARLAASQPTIWRIAIQRDGRMLRMAFR